jgi:hypothetical protein
VEAKAQGHLGGVSAAVEFALYKPKALMTFIASVIIRQI